MLDPTNYPDDRLYIINDRQLHRIKTIIRFCIKNVPEVDSERLKDLLQELILLEDIDDFIFNEFDISYNNLTLINLDNIFCSKSKQKCLIGNEKYSFYIDRNHLSKDGASLTRNKFIKMIEKF